MFGGKGIVNMVAKADRLWGKDMEHVGNSMGIYRGLDRAHTKARAGQGGAMAGLMWNNGRAQMAKDRAHMKARAGRWGK